MRQKTTKRQEREEEICDLLRTSSQDGRCVEGGTQGACVEHACRVCESMFACASACVSVRVPVGKWAGLARKSASGSQGWTRMRNHLCSSFLPQAARLWWLVTPAGAVNPQFPLHNQSGRAKARDLHNVKLSGTSYQASFGLCVFKCGRRSRTRGPLNSLPLVGTPDLLCASWCGARKSSNSFDFANHHTGNCSITRFTEQREHRGPCSPESAQQAQTAWHQTSSSDARTSPKPEKKKKITSIAKVHVSPLLSPPL